MNIIKAIEFFLFNVKIVWWRE